MFGGNELGRFCGFYVFLNMNNGVSNWNYFAPQYEFPQNLQIPPSIEPQPQKTAERIPLESPKSEQETRRRKRKPKLDEEFNVRVCISKA